MENIFPSAAVVAEHRRNLTPLPDLGAMLRPADLSAAYAVQARAHTLLVPALGRRIGYKIGCTTPVMQRYLGIPSPCAGGLFEKTTHGSGAKLPGSRFVRVGIECEIAVRMGADLPAGRATVKEELVEAIADYLPAIEIVDDRYEDWRAIGTPTLVADDFFAAGCVLGAAVPAGEAGDLAAMAGRTFVNGRLAGSGVGADVMGHPHNALAWIADHLAALGTPLQAGEIVLTGSLVQTVWLEPGDRVRIVIDGLGEAALSIASAR